MVHRFNFRDFNKLLLQLPTLTKVARTSTRDNHKISWPFNANSGISVSKNSHIQYQIIRFREDDPCITDCCPLGKCIPDCDCGKPVKKRRPPCKLHKKEIIIEEEYDSSVGPIFPTSREWFKTRPPPKKQKKLVDCGQASKDKPDASKKKKKK